MQANREGAYGAPFAIGVQNCFGECRIARPAPNLLEVRCGSLLFPVAEVPRSGLCIASVDPDCSQYVVVQGIWEMGVEQRIRNVKRRYLILPQRQEHVGWQSSLRPFPTQ